jgi:iron(III) transport system permease protein
MTQIAETVAQTDPDSLRRGGAGRPMSRRRSSVLGSELASMIPVLLLLTVLIIIPVVYVLYGAVQSASPGDPRSTFTLESLHRVYASDEFVRTLIGTGLLAIGVGILTTILGGLFAWLIGRTNMPARKFFEVVVMAPLFLSPFVGAIAWVALAAPNSGMLNIVWRELTGATSHLVDVMTVSGMVFVLTFSYTPYAFLFIIAALRNMDPSLEEASALNGAGRLRTALTITFPLVRPAILASFFFVAVLTAGVFSVPAVLATSRTFVPLAVRIQRAMSNYPTDPGLAASIGTVLIVVTMVGIIFYRRSLQMAAKYVTVTGRGFRPRTVPLRVVGKAVAVAACVLYGVVGVVLPYFALVIIALSPFTVTDLSELQLTVAPMLDVVTSSAVREGLMNTLIIAALVPTACLVLGLWIAYLVEKRQVRGRNWLDYIATIPVAVPGIVIGTGIVWAYIKTPLYATIWIIVLAFIAQYVPQATRVASNGLLQIDKSLEEASTINGATRITTLRRITVPLVKPAMLSAWIMIFIFATREINAAIVLAGPKNTLLSVMAWDYLNDGSMARAATIGLLQTLMLLAAIAVGRLVFRVKLGSAAA